MTEEPYIPRPDSLAGRVVVYFARLPDEELSHTDIALKWHADAKNVPVQLKLAVDAGLLARDGSVYSAGPEIGRVNLTPQAVVTSAKPAPKKPRIAPPLDIEAIEFEDAPPSAAQMLANVHTRWVAKLRTMAAGKCLTVDIEHRHALRTAATALNKKGWKLPVLTDRDAGKVRVVCQVVGETQ